MPKWYEDAIVKDIVRKHQEAMHKAIDYTCPEDGIKSVLVLYSPIGDNEVDIMTNGSSPAMDKDVIMNLARSMYMETVAEGVTDMLERAFAGRGTKH